MKSQIRLAVLADLGEIAEIYNEEIRHSTATFDLEPVTLEERQDWYSSRDLLRHPVVVFDSGGTIAGWASLSPWAKRCGYARAAEVSVYVDKAHRGKGIGRALIVDLLERGRESGLGVVLARISTGEGPASRGLHESLGFDYVGTMHRVGEKFGRVLDVNILEIQLDSY